MGLPEVEVSPVHFVEGLTLGQRCVPEGGQRHQRRVEEEGTEGVGLWAIWGQSRACWDSWCSPRINFHLGWGQLGFAVKQDYVCLYPVHVPGT